MPPLAQRQVRPSDSLAEVVQLYEGHGFPSSFLPRAGGNVHCQSCGRDNPARWVKLLAMHRLEAAPGATAVAAVECPACEERGVLSLGLGPQAPAAERLVLANLDDRRLPLAIVA